MKQTRRLKQLIQNKLPPKQQTFDFGQTSPWSQMAATDQQACCDAIAALLYHVTKTILTRDPFHCPESNEHE
jgi:hypothetical protein